MEKFETQSPGFKDTKDKAQLQMGNLLASVGRERIEAAGGLESFMHTKYPPGSLFDAGMESSI